MIDWVDMVVMQLLAVLSLSKKVLVLYHTSRPLRVTFGLVSAVFPGFSIFLLESKHMLLRSATDSQLHLGMSKMCVWTCHGQQTNPPRYSPASLPLIAGIGSRTKQELTYEQ